MLTIVNEGSSLIIVNEGLLLTLVNETTNFIKSVVFEEMIVLKKIHATLSNVVVGEPKLLDIFFKTAQ